MTNTDFDPRTAQATATLLSLSLALGVTIFAAVTWFLHQRGVAPSLDDPGLGNMLLYIWIGLTAACSVAAVVLWRSRVEPLVSGSEPLPRARLGELLAGHLLCLAVVEGASLFGVTIYLMTGVAWPAIVSVALIWLAVLSTRPQLEWYERFR